MVRRPHGAASAWRPAMTAATSWSEVVIELFFIENYFYRNYFHVDYFPD